MRVEERVTSDDLIWITQTKIEYLSAQTGRAMTGLESVSLGAGEYGTLLEAVGISIVREYEDKSDNHYFEVQRVVEQEHA